MNYYDMMLVPISFKKKIFEPSELKPDTIKYDSAAIATMKQKIVTSSNNLTVKKNIIIQTINDLNNEWNTPAGKTFLSEIDFDWAKQVEQYVAILDAISDMLTAAESTYDEVTEKASAINF